VVGTAALLVPHPDGHPWLGLLILEAARQGQGLGSEAALGIESALGGEGWSELRLGVLESNAHVLPFWQRLGYRIVDERNDSAGRPCRVLAKPLAAAEVTPDSTGRDR
jgi:ribosomal protein S18 acetylase RimI-like enzyme